MKRVLIHAAASLLVCLSTSAVAQVDFSHDIGTVGAPGSAVNASPNLGEVFSAGGGSNSLAANLPSMGLVFGDNIDAFDRGDVFSMSSGVSLFPFLFSVEAGAVGQPPYPVWAQVPFNGADVYAMQSGSFGHVLAYNEPGLGLLTNPTESLDGMTDSMVGAGQRVYFSLQQGSPTLLANAWSGADVLSVVIGAPGSLRRAFRASDIGLIPADELDGLAIFAMEDGGDGVVDPAANEGALVYFSVDQTSVGEIGTDVRQRSLTSLHHGGDIYLSGVSGGHTLLHEADRRLGLGAGDILDALKLGSTDPLDPFPMYGPGFPDPSDEPEKPASCPPYRGGGVPIGTVWVEVCDASVPSIVNWQIEIKMCDGNGNTMSVIKQGRVKGAASTDPHVKAQMIKDAFESVMLDKPGQMPPVIPVFKGFAKFVPPINVPRPGISGEVCMFVNQDVIDCGWNVDRICFSFSNWTANIIVKPVKGWFPDAKRRMSLMVDGVADSDTLLRISATDTVGPGGIDASFMVPVAAGQDGLSALLSLSQHIADQGGSAPVNADGEMVVESLPIEPPVSEDGLFGPLVYEAGAIDNADFQITVVAGLARGPNSPCNAVDYAEPYGSLNFLDVSAFLERYANGIGDADLAYDGSFNFFDVSKFLELYGQGCPESDGTD
tara:strand:- start:108881 stop:110863 length:1983 start_codon:yes stop_codon:yes gene_type:complete